MASIRILDEKVVNRIAAGEVVERPASALKELLDNAVDAGATRIEIRIEKSGKGLIRVTDDGAGMSYEDALLSLERNATSKIIDERSLDSIATMGFRGEAIPSIASVSRFSLVTRKKGSVSGTSVFVDAGTIREVKETGCAEGTTVEVRGLFEMIPARRKFLRSDATEDAHLEQALRCHALAHPHVGYFFQNDRRAQFHWPGSLSPDATALRVTQIFGREWFSLMIPLKQKQGDLAVEGWTSKPEFSQDARIERLFFLNSRPVTNPVFTKAGAEAYASFQQKGRSPAMLLFLRLPGSFVDVNVHPAKKEVRFRDPISVKDFLAGALKDALQQNLVRPQLSGDPHPVPMQADDDATRPDRPYHKLGATALSPSEDDLLAKKVFLTKLVEVQGSLLPEPSREPLPHKKNPSEHPFKWVGVILGQYILTEEDSGLALIDQVAAHRRVVYEKLLGQIERGKTPSQGLLLPITLDFLPAPFAAISARLPYLKRAGFGIEPIGGKSLMVDAVPACLPAEDIESFFDKLSDELSASMPASHKNQPDDTSLTRLVCKLAITRKKNLSDAEIDRLLSDLHRCRLPYTCPEGKPTMIHISRNELARKFGNRP